MLETINMFYDKEEYFNELDQNIKDSKILEELVIDTKFKGKIESELRISLIIKSTRVLEKMFYDICKEFAIMHSSPIFHRYFEDNFAAKGKNVDTNRVNSLLKILGIREIKKSDNPIAFTSLNSLYNIRNESVHGNANFTESLEIVRDYIYNAKQFFRELINRFDEYSKEHPNEKR